MIIDSNIDMWTIASNKLITDEQHVLDDEIKNNLRDPMMNDFKVRLLKDIDDTKWMFTK